MAKHKVKTAFSDQHTGTWYPAGSTFTGSPERVKELRAAGVLETDEPKTAPKAK